MKSFVRFMFFTLCIVLSSSAAFFQDCQNNGQYGDQSRKLIFDEKLIWEATSDVIDEIGSFVKETKIDDVTKEGKRKKRKRFLKRLVTTVVHLAARLAVKELVGCIRNDKEAVVELVVELCEDLHNVFESDGKQFEHEIYLPCLHCIFLEKDSALRAEKIRKKLLSKQSKGVSNSHRSNQFLQEIISTLFECCSEKLVSLNRQFYKKIEEKYKHLCKGKPDVLRSTTHNAKTKHKTGELCYNIAAQIIERVGPVAEPRVFRSQGVLQSSQRSPIPAILCLLRLVADIGDLAFGRDADEESSSEGKLTFMRKTTSLVKELYDFLACDDLLTSLKKLSDFIARLDEIQSEEEWDQLVKKVLESSQDGLQFLEDAFSNLNLYLQESLSKVFSGVFCRLSQALCTGE